MIDDRRMMIGGRLSGDPWLEAKTRWVFASQSAIFDHQSSIILEEPSGSREAFLFCCALAIHPNFP
jgi:hypothetical protein